MPEEIKLLPNRKSPVSLREVTAETVREILRLKVTPEQEQFVASNAVSIAQAYFQRERAWFRAIYAGEAPVGFLMLYDDPVEPEYFLWRFMIDAQYQGMGFGKQALDLLVEHVRTRPGATHLGTSCVPKPGGPCPFYERYGFTYTGEEDEGELVMRLPL
jgi:diamine N-acetyltransferase